MATLTTNHGASIGVTFYINNRLIKKILIILIGILILASCSRVSGTYESEKISLVDQVEFVGNSSCIVTYFGMKLPTKYRIDNGHILVEAGQGLNLMFEILNSEWTPSAMRPCPWPVDQSTGAKMARG